MRKALERAYMALILVFMYAPIVTLVVLSFNASKSRAKWGGFTLEWYAGLFHDANIINALANTLVIALLATLFATIIGTVTCVALMGLRTRTRAIIMATSNIPMINAEIVTGISLMLLFRALHVDQGFVTVLLAHITFNIPYVMLSVLPRMKTIDPNVFEAARDLGATPVLAFRTAVLPDLAPAVLSGALMAFTMSLDDFIVTYFTKGSGFDTLSTLIYNEVKKGIQPELYALSSLILVVVLGLLLASYLVRRRAERGADRPRRGRPRRQAHAGTAPVLPAVPAATVGASAAVEADELRDEDERAGRRHVSRRTAIGLGLGAAGIALVGAKFGGVFSKKPDQLYVYNWGEYIDPDVVEQFQDETGIQVIYDEFESNEIMYAKLAQDPSAYDVVCPSDYMVSKLISDGLLSPLDWDALPSARENIGAQYLRSATEFDPGNQYCVPYCWGTIGILYNTRMVDEDVTSWNALWDPKYAGQILMQDSIRDCFMVPLAKDGFSINSTDPAELGQAAQDLIDQAPLVQAYVIDQVRDKMIGDEAALGVIYSGEAIYTQRENPDLRYVVPDEGSNVWIDGWVITSGSRNRDNALKWIEFMCRPEIALKNFEYITYSTPNTAARELIEDDDIRNSEIAFPPDEVLERCETFSYLGPEADELYGELWKKVKSAT